MGVDMEKLDLIRPMNGQDALDAMRMIAESGLYSIVCLDSVAALVTQEEMESSASDHNIAPVAQLMSSLLKKMVHPLYKTNTVAIFINQTRLKPMTMFGNPTQSTGGKALRFYASIRLEVKRNEFIKNGTDVVGSRIAVVVQKNKVAAPFEKANFDFYFNDDTQFGIDSSTELIDAGLALGAIERHGSSWFHFGEEKFNGREALKKRIAGDADFKSQLYDRVISV
jgi:recombination protein RecA